MIFCIEYLKTSTNFIIDPKDYIVKELNFNGQFDNDYLNLYSFNNNFININLFSLKNRVKPTIIKNDDKTCIIFGHSGNLELKNDINLDELYGNFNLIIISNNNIKYIKDFTNSFDTFFYEDNSRVILTNNPLLILNKVSSEPDYKSIGQYLIQYYGLFYDKYFFSNIKKIKPRTVFTFSKHNFDKNLHNYLVKLNCKNPENIFNQIITYSTAKKINYGVDITGGYDTRLINACFLKNNISYSMVVHGEDSPEVQKAKEISKIFNKNIVHLSINEYIDVMLKNWLFYFNVGGGLNNFFELLKEGIRSNVRMRFVDTKVTGGLGEPLRDKWYLDKYGRNALNHTSIEELLIIKLFDHIEIYNFISLELKNIIDNYKKEFIDEFREFKETNKFNDLTQYFVIFKYLNMTRGWMGNLNMLHHNFIEVIAPYMDNQFLINLIGVDEQFRKRATGMTTMINDFEPRFRKINFIDGQICRPMNAFDKAIFLYNKVLNKVRKEIYGYSQVTDYNHREWLNSLMKDEKFLDIIQSDIKEFDIIISKKTFSELLNRLILNNLSYPEKHLLWKLITIKINMYLNKYK